MRSSALAICAALLSIVNLRAEFLLQPDDVVAVCAAVRPGREMVSVDIAAYLLMCQSLPGIRVIQSCQREDSVEGFMKRLENDIAPWKPNVVLTSHGVGEGFNGPDSRGLTFYYPTYLGMTVDLLKKIGSRVNVIGSPTCVDAVLFRHMSMDAKTWNDNLSAFRDNGREVSDKGQVHFADIYGPMMETMKKSKAALGETYGFLGPDGITPDQNGQLIMAYIFLKALGCDGSIGTISFDLESGKAGGSSGQTILSSRNGTLEIESARYPFCFKGGPGQPDSTPDFFPFNIDLNRYLLVVKGLNGSRTRITWGRESREFSAGEVENGVNLAAAFSSHSPFDAQFSKVKEAVWQQQQKHTLFASYFRNLKNFKELTPESTAALDKIAADIIQQDKQNTAAAAALVIPIRHTLKIEAIP